MKISQKAESGIKENIDEVEDIFERIGLILIEKLTNKTPEQVNCGIKNHV